MQKINKMKLEYHVREINLQTKVIYIVLQLNQVNLCGCHNSYALYLNLRTYRRGHYSYEMMKTLVDKLPVCGIRICT